MPRSIYLIFFIELLAITTARGNYGYGQQSCDSTVYNRAREMLRLELQRVNSQAQQPPVNSYSLQTNAYQQYPNGSSGQVSDHQCKLIRHAFDDLLMNLPLCESIGKYEFQNSASLLQQTRTFLIQHCERNQGWLYSQCYKRADMKDCENRYNVLYQQSLQKQYQSGYQSSGVYQPSYQPQPQPPAVSYELCLAFESFRNCTLSVSRLNCYSTDLEYLGTYMVDKAQAVAWSCLPHQIIQPIISNPVDPYSRRTDVQLYPNNAQVYNSQYPPYNQPGIASNPSIGISNPAGIQPLPTYHQGGNQPIYDPNNIDRFGGGALVGVYAGSIDVCIKRVRPFENQCTDHLIQRQKEARYGRSSNDVQRRICCALFYYRDCLSRIVLERCVGSTRMAVDILLGDRNREIVTSCRDVTRDQCNGSPPAIPAFHSLLASIFLYIFLIKHF